MARRSWSGQPDLIKNKHDDGLPQQNALETKIREQRDLKIYGAHDFGHFGVSATMARLELQGEQVERNASRRRTGDTIVQNVPGMDPGKASLRPSYDHLACACLGSKPKWTY